MKRFLFLFVALSVSTWVGPLYGAMPEIHGFGEFAYGVKLSDDTTKRNSFNLFEQRLQLKTNHFFEEGYLGEKGGVFNLKGDFTVDEYYSGKTGFELRELNLSLSPLDMMDVKAGRQVLTWGTGDYLFINDMFPKDYVSFFTGREDEYLKKPSDAVKASFYPQMMNIDFIVVPCFTPNTLAQGDRLSFFDSFQGGIAGTNSDREIIEPPWRMSNNEYAARLYRGIGSHEWALYYFKGLYKNPTGYKDELNRELFYPRVDVYGWSVRGPFFSGISNLEFGYNRSREDSDGSNRLIANSMLKVMGGYSKNLGNDWSVGFQYLFENRLNYGNYKDNLLPADYVFDEYRHLLTQRITKMFKNQTVQINLFNFYSPSDSDGYVRSSAAYDINDQWKVTVGANLLWGEDDITQFGMMKKNKNIFFRFRYHF
ncbi:MAG: hypothetical protein KAR05_01760 [Candidatus Omnitrophica bacterium]|nr:hypothetical protein [Candidatus Omnitrophota bacterium]